MATAGPDYYCHKCQVHIGHVTNFECPRCNESFIEEVSPSQRSSSYPRSNRYRGDGRIRFHTPTSSSGNTRIIIGGNAPHASNPRHIQIESPDIGTFFQAVLAQIVGGGEQSPFGMHNGGGTAGGGGGFLDPGNLDVFLTHFLNQMGENSGPAPAAENLITSIPTVKVTAAQARDSLQCAICMDDFKENDQAKRLPCSHHFHEDCISRWLRMHGTCPTCRVTLDGDNTANREYYNLYSNQNQSSPWNNNNNNNNNNRRNDRGNNGSGSSAGSTLYDFD